MTHVPRFHRGPDPYDLGRFEQAQLLDYTLALSELQAGQKRSHWIWFIFPQIAGLGLSPISKHYAIELRSCATLFACVAPAGSVFERILVRYYGGGPDERTLALLGHSAAPPP